MSTNEKVITFFFAGILSYHFWGWFFYVSYSTMIDDYCGWYVTRSSTDLRIESEIIIEKPL